MKSDLWVFEIEAQKMGHRCIAGIDEAGRGPLAGPVVSAAVILPENADLPGIDDSKKLTPTRRNRLYDRLYGVARAIGVGVVDAAEIDRANILQATLRSMAMAVANLCPQPDCLLIDGIFPIATDLPQKTIKKGDSRSISIAAASIVAKVTRDRIMTQVDLLFPEFGFSRHKGYPTQSHRAAIAQYGCSPIHRRTFKGVREHILKGSSHH
ncbi:ribonuclease HII [Desulfosarcina ovata]|uniref:Ribonuclease HII n=1 Tax=Desulfosarcina ovata subsp. ovata TaxID=2752305 RepID=A0A5K8A9N8_9BACT|nr:ribonuclease HII [Desulfosarcina ovata]BBO89199.1 ribonuclease HII [Desulfosarcina ovata subsp. ovata]